LLLEGAKGWQPARPSGSLIKGYIILVPQRTSPDEGNHANPGALAFFQRVAILVDVVDTRLGRSPTIKYEIQEDGTVTNAVITRKSGVADLDQKFPDAISRWKYKPRPAGCGVIENHRLGFIPIKDALLPGFSAYRQLIHRDRSAHRTPSVRQRDIQTGGEHQFILFLTGGRVRHIVIAEIVLPAEPLIEPRGTRPVMSVSV
jgi:TonB family protein